MPRTHGPVGGSLARGTGEAWTLVTEHLSAIAVWAAIGFGLDRLLGTAPVLFVIGTLVGNGAGIYLIYRRSVAMEERDRMKREESTGSDRGERQ